MDHLEFPRQLRSGLVALVLSGVALVAAACVADDATTAGLGGDPDAATTLPVATTRATADAEVDPESGDDEAAPETETTATTEPLPELLGLGADLLADGFDQPNLVTGAPGTDALFVVEREGVIRVVEDGEVGDVPFLDLTDRLNSSSIEQGLLGLAFHPDYASNGRFFAYWTGPDGNSHLAEFRASEPTVADPDSQQLLLEIDQPAERHNAGMVTFGPDGLLYVSVGDGGSGGSTAQDTSNLLGTILRLDVGEPGAYTIPAGNPFDDEIWVYGLRNPWRFSIDPIDGLAYIGDVGQEAFEEINVVALDGAGTNFGWFQMEGDQCFRSECEPSDFTPPVLQYSHLEGCSVTGGWVYRGQAIPEFDGHYFFADWCKSFVRSFRLDGMNVRDQFDWTEDLPELGQVTSFGLDEDGELLVVNWAGELYRIVPRR